MRISPHDILSEGTQVCIGTKRGRVVSHEIVDAIPSGKIVIHTVTLTEKLKITFGKYHTYERIEAEIWTGNYSAIVVLTQKHDNKSKGVANVAVCY